MANLITKILGGSAGQVIDSIAGAADRFITTDAERNAFRLEAEKLLQVRDSEIEQTLRAELGAQERILVAELQQDDKFTKRARPAVVYVGLGVIVCNFCVAPIMAWALGEAPPAFNLPDEFWYAWGGILGVYSFGRSMEKRERRSPPTDLASPVPSRLLGGK